MGAKQGNTTPYNNDYNDYYDVYFPGVESLVDSITDIS
jgi:hypothetical protein